MGDNVEVNSDGLPMLFPIVCVSTTKYSIILEYCFHDL